MSDPSRPWATDEYERLVEESARVAPAEADSPPGPSRRSSPPDGGGPTAGPLRTGHPEDPFDAPAAAPPAEGDVDGGLDQVDALVEEAEEAVEADLDELSRVAAERDDYLLRLQQLQADFENYKKRVLKQQSEHQERAAQDLVSKLLAVLDNFDLALAHGSEDVQPVYRSLLDVLESTGLERLDPAGQPFDPTEHDAVMHEPGDGDPEVIDVLRAGYRWKGRVLRPAMVKVKG